MAKTMLDLSDIVLGNEYKQSFQVKRHSGGKLIKGRFIENETIIEMVGTVSASNDKEINMVPEGDRNKEMKTFYATQPLYITRNSKNAVGTSDMILYDGFEYKVIIINDVLDYGYCKAVCVKVAPND